MKKNGLKVKSGDLALGAELVVPDSGSTENTVVCITGGIATANALYAEWQEYLASEGMASISFDARGLGGSDGFWNTDSEGYQIGDPTNSQSSRVHDTLHVVEYARRKLTGFTGKIAILGSSMGGDVAIKTVQELAYRDDEIDGLILKAPAAYHPSAHYLNFGKDLRSVLQNPSRYPAILSENFRLLRTFNLPTQLIFARGDTVIPDDITLCYDLTVRELPGGEVLYVGEESTGHKYFTDTDYASAEAKQTTLEESAHFLQNRVFNR